MRLRLRRMAASTLSTATRTACGSSTPTATRRRSPGSASPGYSGDGGPATSAALNHPDALLVDGAGNLLIGDYSAEVVRVVAHQSCAGTCPYGLAAMTPGDIYTVAGNGVAGLGGGAATSGPLGRPIGLATDQFGDVFIADSDANRIFELNPFSAPAKWTVSLAGSGRGTVSGGQVNCPTTCTMTAEQGLSVSLCAAAASGSDGSAPARARQGDRAHRQGGADPLDLEGARLHVLVQRAGSRDAGRRLVSDASSQAGAHGRGRDQLHPRGERDLGGAAHWPGTPAAAARSPPPSDRDRHVQLPGASAAAAITASVGFTLHR